MVELPVDSFAAELLEELDPAFLGPKKRVYSYRQPDGTVPARAFLESQSSKVQATYAKVFQQFCLEGRLRGERHHPWNGRDCDSLYAFKDNASQTRLVHTTEKGGLVVLLFGFGGKKEDEIENRHVLRAIRMRDEFQARMAIVVQRSQAQRRR